MPLTIEQIEGGYRVTVVIEVKQWVDIVSELRQFLKLLPDESQEN